MTPNHISQWEDRRNTPNLPPPRRKEPQINHSPNNDHNKPIHDHEPLEDFRNLLEEIRGFFFFGCGAPLAVDGEEVGYYRAVKVEGESSFGC